MPVSRPTNCIVPDAAVKILTLYHRSIIRLRFHACEPETRALGSHHPLRHRDCLIASSCPTKYHHGLSFSSALAAFVCTASKTQHGDMPLSRRGQEIRRRQYIFLS